MGTATTKSIVDLYMIEKDKQLKVQTVATKSLQQEVDQLKQQAQLNDEKKMNSELQANTTLVGQLKSQQEQIDLQKGQLKSRQEQIDKLIQQIAQISSKSK